MKLEDLKKIAAWKTLEEKRDEIISWMEESKVTKKTEGRQKRTYKSVKTEKMYQWHPVYEIEFSNGLKILWANINWHLMKLQPKERFYKDVVNDSLAEWMSDSATKARNRWWQSYWDKNWFPEVDR
jgi:hypothetical protein